VTPPLLLLRNDELRLNVVALEEEMVLWLGDPPPVDDGMNIRVGWSTFLFA
jgi:hypothetical protein